MQMTLKDSQSAEEANILNLRFSSEMNLSGEAVLSSTEARKIAQTLQFRPESVASQIDELTTISRAGEEKIRLLQAEADQLNRVLQDQQLQRWHNPAVYGVGIALGALSFLWLSERKKRISAQEHLLNMPSDMNSVLGMPEGPSVNFSEPHPLEWAHNVTPITSLEASLAQQAKRPVSSFELAMTEVEAIAKSKPLDDLIAEQTTLLKDGKKKLHREEVLPWWGRLRRKQHQSNAAQVLDTEATAAYSSELNYESNTEIQFYDEEEIEDMDPLKTSLNHAAERRNSVLENVELLLQTRTKPANAEDAMGHLLEIRMAVLGLCALDHPQAAQKLLINHITAVPNTCAWAYMEYLELSAKLKQRDEFEAMRKRYRLQFNRLAPYWMEPNSSAQTLDFYERPMAELNAIWAAPELSRTLIATWLLGTLHSRRLFQLPAYHDLLDLYELIEFYDVESTTPEWVSTVSLLDLDYEFAIDVKIEAQPDQEAMRAIPAVKKENFAIDFNVTNLTQPDAS